MYSLRERLLVVSLSGLVVFAAACQDAPTAARPIADAAVADANARPVMSALTVGTGKNTRTFQLVGSDLLHPDGRRIKLDPELAKRLREIATRQEKIEKLAAALAPVWKLAGLLSLEEAAEKRLKERATNGGKSADKAISAPSVNLGGEVASMATASAAMPRTCDEIAIDIYETTISYREAQVGLATALDWIVDCNANGGTSYGTPDFCSPYGVLLASAQVWTYELLLNDMAGTYSNQGCWN